MMIILSALLEHIHSVGSISFSLSPLQFNEFQLLTFAEEKEEKSEWHDNTRGEFFLLLVINVCRTFFWYEF